MSGYVKIADLTRGATVESVHFGAVAVVDADGRLIAAAGDPNVVTYSRSTLKPFQATPTFARGAMEAFGLDLLHVALMCGSHNGEDRHAQAAAEILAAIGCDEHDLNCGVHLPYIYTILDESPPPEQKFTQLHNNCSGKHAGMLALCRLMNVRCVNYLEVTHPAQRAIRETVQQVTGLADDHLILGIDGCTAPNFALPLSSLARAYAVLAAARGADELSAQAMRTIVRAMRTHPAMVSGQQRFDLALAQAASDRLVCKVGGEAVECVALTDRGWGVAVKIADGGSRALGAVTLEVLRQLGVLTADEVASLHHFARPFVTNHRRIIIGEVRPAVNLVRYAA